MHFASETSKYAKLNEVEPPCSHLHSNKAGVWLASEERMLKNWHAAFKERIRHLKSRCLRTDAASKKQMLKGWHTMGMMSSPYTFWSVHAFCQA